MPEVMAAYRMACEVADTPRGAVPDMAEFDAFYKRLVATAPLKHVASRFAMEPLQQTACDTLPARAFHDRRAADTEADRC